MKLLTIKMGAGRDGTVLANGGKEEEKSRKKNQISWMNSALADWEGETSIAPGQLLYLGKVYKIIRQTNKQASKQAEQNQPSNKTIEKRKSTRWEEVKLVPWGKEDRDGQHLTQWLSPGAAASLAFRRSRLASGPTHSDIVSLWFPLDHSLDQLSTLPNTVWFKLKNIYP